MNPIPLNLAVEDLLSEAVCKRLLVHSSRPFHLGPVFGRNGFGYLKRTATGWNMAAASTPFLLLTDLDFEACPSLLISKWLNEPLHPNMIFRIAVREVEAWLMADKPSFSKFFKVKEAKVPDFPETLIDPKRELLRLAAESTSRELRTRLLPKTGSLAKQGPDYNGALSEYVKAFWEPDIAAEFCPSLKKCIQRLREFEPHWS